MSLNLTAQDLPDLCDQLDTIANHDFQAGMMDESAQVQEAYAEAAGLLMDARAKVQQAMTWLEQAGVEWDDDI